MKVYDFDETMFTGDSEDRFFDYIFHQKGFFWYHINWWWWEILLRLKIINKTTARQGHYMFLRKIKNLDEVLEGYWDSVMKYMKPWYMAVKDPEDIVASGTPAFLMEPAMKRLGLTVFGDIGCYTLCALPPVNMMDSTLCMGASVGMASGAEKARGRDFSKKTVAVLGDSTFIHSGITPLVDAVYGGASTTTVILDNRITGMTGHQQNAASGKNILGDPAPQLNLEALCEAIGATVRVCDPHNLKEFTQILKEETEADHVSVVIARRPCALLDKRRQEWAWAARVSCSPVKSWVTWRWIWAKT